jgi:hypothetical protein
MEGINIYERGSGNIVIEFYKVLKEHTHMVQIYISTTY